MRRPTNKSSLCRSGIGLRTADTPAQGRDAGAVHLPSRGATILLLLAVAGCAGYPPVAAPSGRNPRPTSAAPTAALTTAPPTSPRPNCGHARVAGTVVLALPGGRRALFAVPAGDDGHHRLPLVIGLPGYGRTSEELAAQSRIPARAMAAGVLAVLPQAAGSAKSWNLSGTTGNGDVSFLSALVTQLAATECADPARVVITGISDGGDMAVFAACAMPGRFQAGVTVAASINPPMGCHRGRYVRRTWMKAPMRPVIQRQRETAAGSAIGQIGKAAVSCKAAASWSSMASWSCRPTSSTPQGRPSTTA